MTSQIRVEEGKLECLFSYDYIIAVSRRLYGKDNIRFFDNSEHINPNVQIGLEQFEPDRKGVEIADYFGFDRESFSLEHLEAIVQNDSLIVHGGGMTRIQAGSPVVIELDTLPGRNTAQASYSLGRLQQDSLFYQVVEFEKTTTQHQSDNLGLISYKDGTQLQLRTGYDSMGSWFSLERMDGSSIAGGYGSAGPLYHHDGLFFLPLGGNLPLVICIQEYRTSKKALIPEIKKVTFDRLIIEMSWDVNYGNGIHCVYKRINKNA